MRRRPRALAERSSEVGEFNPRAQLVKHLVFSHFSKVLLDDRLGNGLRGRPSESGPERGFVTIAEVLNVLV